MCFRGVSPRLLGPIAFGLLVAQNTMVEALGRRELLTSGQQRSEKEGARVPISLSRIYFQNI